MNYKKSIAFILALSMCVPVVASNISLVSDNVGVYADSTENDSSVSYEKGYVYEDELSIGADNEYYYIDVNSIDSINVSISNCHDWAGFNIGYVDENDNLVGYYTNVGGNPTRNNIVNVTISVKDLQEEIENDKGVKIKSLLVVPQLVGTQTMKVYKGTPVVLTIENISGISNDNINDFPINMTGYDAINLTFNCDFNGGGIFLRYKDGDDAWKELSNFETFWQMSGDRVVTFERSSFTDTTVNEVYVATSDAEHSSTYIDEETNEEKHNNAWLEATISKVTVSKNTPIMSNDTINLITNEIQDYFNIDIIKSVTSSDEEVVSVDENNVVTAVAKGETTLTVEYVTGDIVEIPVNVSTLEINPSKNVNFEDTNVDLTKEITSGTAIKWTSKDESIATIDKTTGILTPVSGGNVTIISEDKYGNKAEISIEITKDEVVQVDKTSIELETTDTHQITITNSVNPKGYTTSDEKIATVDKNGLITAVGEGTATINVISQDDVSTDIIVTVTNPTPVEISSSKSSLIIGEELALTVDNGVAKDWKSSDEKIATVDEDGNVTAIAEGTVTITATDKVGNSDTVDIEVKKFTINRDFLNLAVDDTYTLKSDTSTIQSFTSADESVATVSDKGVVTAVGVGSTTITVEDIFGNKINVSVSVFDDTNYTTGEVSTEEDEDGNTIFKINKGNATEIKLELSSHKYVYAQGAVSYLDSTTETNIEIPWVAEFNNGTTSTVYIGNLPVDVEELVFSVYYSAYWDNSIGDMVNADVTIDSVSGNAESTVTESILPKDILVLKKHILGIKLVDDTTKYDFNGDKSINILDLLYTKRLLLGIVE